MIDETKPSGSQNSGAHPVSGSSRLLMGMIIVTLMLMFLGAVYFDRHSGWFDKQVYGPYASANQLEEYQPKSGAAAAAARGKQVYESVCGVCHGPDGLGKPGQAPPLAGSELVNAKGFHRLAMIPLAGLSGSLQVNGKDWNMAMAPMGAALSDADLAAVLTYIRNSWGNQASAVTGDDIKPIRASMGARPQTLSGGMLKTMPE
ncbi:MAG: cytochrome c [Verrucomicrobiia bacterium]